MKESLEKKTDYVHARERVMFYGVRFANQIMRRAKCSPKHLPVPKSQLDFASICRYMYKEQQTSSLSVTEVIKQNKLQTQCDSRERNSIVVKVHQTFQALPG
jgi:hypothetical protein